MIDKVTKGSARLSGSLDFRAFALGAAAILHARGVPLSRRSVGSLARLARSFAQEGMGRFEALSSAAALMVRRR